MAAAPTPGKRLTKFPLAHQISLLHIGWGEGGRRSDEVFRGVERVAEQMPFVELNRRFRKLEEISVFYFRRITTTAHFHHGRDKNKSRRAQIRRQYQQNDVGR